MCRIYAACGVSQTPNNYDKKEETKDGFVLEVRGIATTQAEEGTDIRAVLDRYISIGTLTNGILAAAMKE